MKVCRRSAYTLIELVLALATSTVILGAMTSAMILATKAVPDAKSSLTAAVDGAFTLDQMTTDLYTANTLITHTAQSVEFQVADRNNDGCPETISYTWSGKEGDPLRRKYNDALPQVALADVREFDITYDATLLDQSFTSAATESDETLLSSNEGPKSRGNSVVTSAAWIGQFFRPNLPANTKNWKITRVDLLLRVDGNNDGIVRVELRNPDASSLPTGTLIADASVLERELSTGYLWHTVNFASTPSLSPSNGVALVVKWLYDSAAVDVQYQLSRTTNGDDALLTTSNGGKNWSAAPAQGLLYRVYGTATGTSRPTAQRLYSVNSVRIKLRSGDDDSSRIETTVPMPNEPEITGT